jgi:hypothetical protein
MVGTLGTVHASQSFFCLTAGDICFFNGLVLHSSSFLKGLALPFDTLIIWIHGNMSS